MIWRPLSTAAHPLASDQPAEGALIVVRTKGCRRPEVCGEWIRGRLVSAFLDALDRDIPVKIPEDPVYLVVDGEPAINLVPFQVFQWFAKETARLDNGQASELEHSGLGRLWCLLDRNGVPGPKDLELARATNRISEEKYNLAHGSGWIKVHTGRLPVRDWFARKR